MALICEAADAQDYNGCDAGDDAGDDADGDGNGCDASCASNDPAVECVGGGSGSGGGCNFCVSPPMPPPDPPMLSSVRSVSRFLKQGHFALLVYMLSVGNQCIVRSDHPRW